MQPYLAESFLHFPTSSLAPHVITVIPSRGLWPIAEARARRVTCSLSHPLPGKVLAFASSGDNTRSRRVGPRIPNRESECDRRPCASLAAGAHSPSCPPRRPPPSGPTSALQTNPVKNRKRQTTDCSMRALRLPYHHEKPPARPISAQSSGKSPSHTPARVLLPEAPAMSEPWSPPTPRPFRTPFCSAGRRTCRRCGPSGSPGARRGRRGRTGRVGGGAPRANAGRSRCVGLVHCVLPIFVFPVSFFYVVFCRFAEDAQGLGLVPCPLIPSHRVYTPARTMHPEPPPRNHVGWPY